MSLFTLIKYPVSTDAQLDDIPSNIWDEYIDRFTDLPLKDRLSESQTNALLIQFLLEWEDE